MELIKDLFSEKGFETYHYGFEFSDQKSFFAASKLRKEYYIIEFLEDINFDQFSQSYIEKCDDYFIKMKKTEYYKPTMDRNTSLVYFIKVPELNNSNNRTLSQKIEEDPYYFKKYVLFYTKKQYNELTKELEHHKQSKLEQSIVNFFNHQVNKPKLFDKYRENPHENSSYNLLIRLFIKIPFLCYQPENDENTLESLNNKINEYIIKNNLLEFYQLLTEEVGSLGESLDSFKVPQNEWEKLQEEVLKEISK